jgi:hypothetical protein
VISLYHEEFECLRSNSKARYWILKLAFINTEYKTCNQKTQDLLHAILLIPRIGGFENGMVLREEVIVDARENLIKLRALHWTHHIAADGLR